MTDHDAGELIRSWRLVASTQRQLAKDEKDIGLRSSLISSSNAWMMAADDLKKHMEKTNARTV